MEYFHCYEQRRDQYASRKAIVVAENSIDAAKLIWGKLAYISDKQPRYDEDGTEEVVSVPGYRFFQPIVVGRVRHYDSAVYPNSKTIPTEHVFSPFGELVESQ